ncbi:leucine-rich repeat domain-containing protein [Prevotella copri]|uniref:leucine-rich repeat domain-containing protein n=1 Tax=Segatella copri TaxID=165179 RepID=UPI001C381D5E|nr:leucine-rich repeat domain-containing protein [Segatella copri]MBV3429086.1 leucine-rich repeat domain-containing protein [Segatella copri]
MRTITFKGLFLTVLFVLLGSLAIQAADDGLITKQITIKLDKAGTLPYRISESKKYLITNLKIVGEVNGTDWKFIRDMAGSDEYGLETDGKLSILDLSDARIVEGGSKYFRYDTYTSNDKLGDYAFSDCRGLTSLTIPSSITSIGLGAFLYCSGLTSLTIPSSVTSIGKSAFQGCCGLTSLAIPFSITSIGESAFAWCSGLTSLTIPSSITSIGKSAFEGCSGLTSIYVYPENLPKLGKDVFNGCDANNCKVYVPIGTYDDYWLSEFGYFENIEEFDATGIDKVTTSNNAKELSRYSVNGQRLSAPSKGLNIVKYSDGSVKKVAVQ